MKLLKSIFITLIICLVTASIVNAGPRYFGGSLYEYIYIDAGAMVPNTTNGAQSSTNEFTTYDLDFDYMAFDTTTEEYVTVKFIMPENWNNGTLKFKFLWSPSDNTGTTANTVEWEVQAIAISDDDTIDADPSGSSQVISDTITAGESADLHITSATPALTIAGSPQAGDLIVFKFSRNVGGTDDYGADAWLWGVYVQFVGGNPAYLW
jgi:hypothetical protein